MTYKTFPAAIFLFGLAAVLYGASGPVVERVTPDVKEVTGFADDKGPIDLLPRLSPLPERVSGVAKPRLDLDGTWRFNPSPKEEFWKSEDEAGWQDIRVPGEWVMQGYRVKARGTAGYRLRFAVPGDWAGSRVKLRFDAVYSKAEVWVNGVAVGAHLGAFTPFEMDVTKAIVPGKENRLDVAVTSDTLADALTVGLEMSGHPMGGIIRKVCLFATPQVNVSSMHVETTFDAQYADAVLRVYLDVVNDGDQTSGNAVANFSLREYGGVGAPVSLGEPKRMVLAMTPEQGRPMVIEFPIHAPKKWDAEHPNLYVLSCELEEGKAHYRVERRFGFRQTEIRDGRMLLNGKPIRLRGISREDTDPLGGRTVTAADNQEDIEALLGANCNSTYTCAFLPDEDMMDRCDEAGLYVLDEPGTCWVFSGGRTGFRVDDPKLYPYFLQPVLEMIERDRSHPCVLTWMDCDESWYGRDWEHVRKVTRATDPSRPIHMAYDPPDSPFDLASWHYPGPGDFAVAARSTRPVVFDQSVSPYFVQVPELMTDPGLRDDWGRAFEAFWEKAWATPSMLGTEAFNLNDDQYLVPGGPVTGNGDWGYTDPWRRAKPELWHIKKSYTPVKIVDGPVQAPAAGQPLEVPVENRYDFSNLNEVEIQWAVGGESGTARADVAPHEKGMITIRPAATADLNGKTLSLTFARNGRMLDAYQLPIGNPIEPPVPPLHKPGRPAELVETEKDIRVECDGYEWVVSRETGQIVSAGPKGKPVLVGGPVLMVLPTWDMPMTPGFPSPNPRPQSFAPLNDTCTEWKAESVVARQAGDGVEIVVAGHYREASGGYTIRILGAGDAEVEYKFAASGGKKFTARQTGMVCYAPRSLDTLSWQRKAQWSVYPEDHIGRPEGEAKALPDPSLVRKAGSWMEVSYREKPTWGWSADANELGTRDFRATRRNILRATLSDAAGEAVSVLSDGAHEHYRAFLDGGRIGFLVAAFSGPGSPGEWLHGLYKIAGMEPLRVEKGTEFKDRIRLSLAGR